MFSKLIVGGATSSAETAVLSALSSKQGFFRAACTSACTSVSFDNPVVHETYQEALTMSVNDPNFTLANAINKGYAYLACNRDLFSWQILECFELALKLDPEQKHSAIINCGVKQVLENEKACYHLMKGNESIKITLTPS